MIIGIMTNMTLLTSASNIAAGFRCHLEWHDGVTCELTVIAAMPCEAALTATAWRYLMYALVISAFIPP